MSFGLLSLGTQSLQANQTALTVTGQNISNVNTEGYSRQRPVFLSREDQAGVLVNDVDRIADEFLNKQIWSDSSTYKSFEIYRDYANELDNLMASDVTSVSKAMDDYFGALQTAVDDPVSLPNRELFLAQADALVRRFNDLDSNIRRQNETINGRLESATAAVNTIAQNIAQLNDDIRIATAAGQVSNELLDQRDAKLEELSEYIGFTTISEPSTGEVSVFVGNGEPLVVGLSANKLVTSLNPADSSMLNISLKTGNNEADITRQVSGGIIGGTLTYRDTTLNQSLDELGRIALVFAETMNEQHQKGIDLDGNAGGLLFTDINAPAVTQNRVIAYRDNGSTVNSTVIINEADKLQASEYNLIFNDTGTFTITRESDGMRWESNTLNLQSDVSDVDEDGEYAYDPLTGELDLRIDGFSLSMRTDTGFIPGDQYLIRPTRNAASEIESVITNGRQLALAAPLAVAESGSNQGTGEVEVIITDPEFATLSNVENTLTPPATAGLAVVDPAVTPLTFQVSDYTKINNLSFPISVEHLAPGTGSYEVKDSTGATIFGPAVPAPTATEIDLDAAYGLTLTVGGTGSPVGVSSIEYDSTLIDDNRLTPPLQVAFLPELEGAANTGNQFVSLPADLNVTTGTTGLTFSSDAVSLTDAEEVGSVGYPLTFDSLGGGNYQVTPASGGPFVVTASVSGTDVVFDMTDQIGLKISATGVVDGAGLNSFTVQPADVNKVEHTPVFTAQTGSPSAIGSIEARVTDTALVGAAQYPLTVTYTNVPAGTYEVADTAGNTLYSGVANADGNLSLPSLGLDIHVDTDIAVNDTVMIAPEQNSNINSAATINNIRVTDERLMGAVTFPVQVVYDGGSSTYVVTDSANPSTVLFNGGAQSGALDMTKTFGFAIDVNNPPEVPGNGDSFIIQHSPDSKEAAYVVLTDADGDRVVREYEPNTPIALSGYEVVINNRPQVGDTFQVTLNTGGVSDNRNSLLMSDLQAAKLIDGASYQDQYGLNVERVGSEAAVAQVNAKAGKSVLDANIATREGISGVNLDEEAAKLVQFQQAYQASAQLIRAAQTIFDTLLQSV
ncbi:flagellar hook-associated protein FlgK [Neptuniibacter sp. QD37_11]|uniref:flagellar hook-associated protein FlgK n=1 Tax=Neptuniibacter sp. QD37_11 TaxID=3398209 RepID=UPI0039F55FF5